MIEETSNCLIAPCGMNCGICYAYLREKNKCFCCHIEDPNKPKTRLNCKIKNCGNLAVAGEKYSATYHNLLTLAQPVGSAP